MLRKFIKNKNCDHKQYWKGSNYIEKNKISYFTVRKFVKIKNCDYNQCWQRSDYLEKREF